MWLSLIASRSLAIFGSKGQPLNSCVTEAELWEYEDRRDRICQLYAELIDRGVTCSGC
jgi:hypothetical protein